jgi:hypothetical protein
LIAESNKANNTAAVRLPDIEAVSLNWNDVRGNDHPDAPATVSAVNLVYRINSSGLDPNTGVGLYWAQGKTILTEAYWMPAGQVTGADVPVTVSLAALQPAPAGANRLVLYVDPNPHLHDPALPDNPFGATLEQNEDNNKQDLVLYQRKDSSVIIPPQIADQVAQMAADYYLATSKILVITSGLRTPRQQATIIYNIITSNPKGIEAGIQHVRAIYHDGPSIKAVLKVYDRTVRARRITLLGVKHE